MKNGLMLFLVIVSAVFFANNLHANEIQQKYHVVSVADLSVDFINDFFSGNHPEMILECTEGSIIPIYTYIKCEYLVLEDSDIYQKMTILKTCFIKNENKTFLFSSDLENWKKFHDFFSGRIGLAVSVMNGSFLIGLNYEFNNDHNESLTRK